MKKDPARILIVQKVKIIIINKAQMSNLLNEQESNYQEPIYPGAKLAILLGNTRFNMVQKLCKGYDEKYKQMYSDLPEI